MKTKIYVLCEPDGEIRYVGKTGRILSVRFFSHLYEARGSRKKYHLYTWLRSVLSKGYLPKIQEIGEVEGNGNREEMAWITYGKAEGWRLVNSTDGGEGTSVSSDEGRKVISERLKKMYASGWNPRLGKHHSEESNRKNSLAHKGKPNGCLGHRHTEESKRKMSLSQTGRKQSEETKCKISGILKRHYTSPEAREQRSHAVRLSWETRRKNADKTMQ